MKIGILAEHRFNQLERRVALVPDAVRQLVAKGFRVVVESSAGARAFFSDEQYHAAGAEVASSAAEVIAAADVVCALTFPAAVAESFRAEQVLITLVQEHRNRDAVASLVERGVRILALERVPRTSRAQAMDVLSSMATVAGYRAVILAAERLPRFLPMLTSAAGTLPPAHVLVLGAGVAGLQAIATARRLGAQVSAYDVRPAAQEQIASLGARPIQLQLNIGDAETAGGYARKLDEDILQRQREELAPHIKQADILITTAAVPGQRAPLLVSRQALEAMKPGSVVVDLAAESGGNTELTAPGEEVALPNGTVVLAPLLIPAQLPQHASVMFSRNLTNLLMLFAQGSELRFHLDDEILRAMALGTEVAA